MSYEDKSNIEKYQNVTFSSQHDPQHFDWRSIASDA